MKGKLKTLSQEEYQADKFYYMLDINNKTSCI